MQVVIVGRDTYLSSFIAKSMERSGYSAACILYEKDVFSVIAAQNAALVIADLETDETERIRFCRGVKALKNPPKLFIIGSSFEEEAIMLNAGADDWIEKPYNTEVFLARVSALLRQSINR